MRDGTLLCAGCGISFTPDRVETRYHSIQCFNQSRIEAPWLRFDRKYEKTADGCWRWTGTRNKAGYGLMYIPGRGMVLAHRISLEIHTGSTPDPEKYVCHKCDVTCCVNPSHLFIGTPTDNVMDSIHKGRYRNGTVRGEQHHRSVLTSELVLVILSRKTKAAKGASRIARELGLTRGAVASVLVRKSWKHVTETHAR